MKKVLLIIIDALATRIVEPAIQAGRLPNMARLVDAGALHKECIAVFPSITPAATGSLATGCYPHEHGILGAYWYDDIEQDVAYFGSDVWTIIGEGVERYVVDFQSEMNAKRLQVPTIFEQVERHGHLRDAVINLLWFRGTIEHAITWPTVLKLVPGTGDRPMMGPHLMFMGDFVNTKLQRGEQLSPRGGMLRRFGFHDETTADYLLQLAETEPLPDLTIAYFPNNDFDGHKVGPEQAAHTIEAVDEVLGELFELHGGLESMLADYAILITGDHSQSDLPSAAKAAVDLDEVLADFQLVPAGNTFRAEDDIMVCPNMRAAQIYFNRDSWLEKQHVVQCLADCSAIDQVIWSDVDDGLNEKAGAKFTVVTRDRGELTFKVASPDNAMGQDAFGGHWQWTGALSAVDAALGPEGELQFKDYPNAFERIATSFHQQSGSIWVTAKLGCEFCLPGTSGSEKGSHGSLHAFDSISPLIVAGLSESIDVPTPLRSVDITPICLKQLGLSPQREPGRSHVASSE